MNYRIDVKFTFFPSLLFLPSLPPFHHFPPFHPFPPSYPPITSFSLILVYKLIQNTIFIVIVHNLYAYWLPVNIYNLLHYNRFYINLTINMGFCSIACKPCYLIYTVYWFYYTLTTYIGIILDILDYNSLINLPGKSRETGSIIFYAHSNDMSLVFLGLIVFTVH